MNDVFCSAKAEEAILDIELCKSLYSECPSDYDKDTELCSYFLSGMCNKEMTIINSGKGTC